MSTWQDTAMQLRTNGSSWNEIAREIQCNYFPSESIGNVYDKCRSHVRRNLHKVEAQEQSPQKGSCEQRQDGTIVSDKLIEIIEGEEITPFSLLKAHGLDAGKWQVVSYRNNYWHSQVKGGKRLVMYQSKLTAKPIKDGVSLEHIDDFFTKLDRKNSVPIEYKSVPGFKRCMAEVNIADLHLGKLCWSGNTGGNYDHKIARENFRDIIARICHELSGKSLEYILFVWSNDYFNSDTI
jgi:hypothetical protein